MPSPGVNGQWDLWVTSLDGKMGQAMLANIPGNQMIYIPAAVAQAQPPTADFRYTFTPKGATAPFTILVPAAVIAAYQKTPKTEMTKRVLGSEVFGHAALQNIVPPWASSSGVTCAQDVTAVMNRAQSIVSNFPPDGSDASAYAAWLLSTAAQVPSVISDVNAAIDCINQGSATGDISMLQALIAKLLPLVAKATQAASQGSTQVSVDTSTS